MNFDIPKDCRFKLAGQFTPMKRYYINVIDKSDNKMKVVSVNKSTYDRIFPEKEIETLVEKEYVCADCGTEAEKINVPCSNCKGRRIVLISVVEESFGKDWKK